MNGAAQKPLGAAQKTTGQATGTVNKAADTGADAVNKGVATATGTSTAAGSAVPSRLDFSAPSKQVLQYLPPWLVSTWAAADTACHARG